MRFQQVFKSQGVVLGKKVGVVEVVGFFGVVLLKMGSAEAVLLRFSLVGSTYNSW